MSFLSWLRRHKAPTIRFASFLGNFSISSPVVAARKLRPSWAKRDDKKSFSTCPGLLDFAQAGFIVCAHTDIHIKANSAGMVVRLGNLPLPRDQQERLQPASFDFDVVAGMAPIQPGVVKKAMKIPLPWAALAEDGWSAYVLPATMHSPFLADLFVYPGIVDYDRYHTCNFVFSPLRECEITIPAGTPLLQVLPFRREEITGSCGKATELEYDRHVFGHISRVKGYYRKMFHSKKVVRMEACPFHKTE